MNTDGDLGRRLAALEALVEAQQAELDRLRDQAANRTERSAAAPASVAATEQSGGIGRRAMLRGAGLATLGAVVTGGAVVAGAGPAAAADGDPIVMGQTTVGTKPTVAVTNPVTTTGFAFTDDTGYTPNLPGAGGPPVMTISASGHAVSALLAASSTGIGLQAGGTYGVQAAGDLASLHLTSNRTLDPTQDDRYHQGGELVVVRSRLANYTSLWFCVQEGTPGEWVMLAGFGSPSTFNPIDPTRLYDSRDGDGPLAGGDTRTVYLGVPVAALQEADVVNLTITDTVDSGYLSLYSAALSSPPLASSINWFTSGQIAANMAITKVDSNGNVKVTAGGPGSTNFVIDLLGWFD